MEHEHPMHLPLRLPFAADAVSFLSWYLFLLAFRGPCLLAIELMWEKDVRFMFGYSRFKKEGYVLFPFLNQKKGAKVY